MSLKMSLVLAFASQWEQQNTGKTSLQHDLGECVTFSFEVKCFYTVALVYLRRGRVCFPHNFFTLHCLRCFLL